MNSPGAHSPTRGALWALASATAYSLSGIFGKDLLDYFGPSSIIFWRFSIASAVLWVTVLLRRRAGGPDPFDVPRLKVLALGVLFGLMVLMGFIALDRLDASLYIVLVYVYPVLVVIGSALLGTRPAPLTWVALAIVMVGIVFTVPELFGGVGEVSALGIVLTLAQAVVFATYMIVSGRVMPRSIDGVVTATWIMSGAMLAIMPVALVEGLVLPRGGELVFKVAVFALIPTVVSSVCFFQAMRHIVPGAVAMVLTIEVALVIVWARLFLGEALEATKIVGAIVVIGGVLLAQWANLREARLAEVPLPT